jgi:alkylhydroperoxidase/carboxymuconolactone decarboxylase family protein YurZ
VAQRADRDLIERGERIRREVLGDAYVDANLASADDFMMVFQDLVNQIPWGLSWTRTALDRKTRCLVTIGILGALGRRDELKTYARAAVGLGATPDEIADVLAQVMAYCGAPAARQSFLAAHEALIEAGALPPKRDGA